MKRHWLIACLLLAATAASAQMLARPGWNGSGFNADPWWKHAIFYQPAQASDAKSVTAQLGSLQSLGADALILPTPALPAAGATDIDTSFDDLISESGRRGIHILLTLTAPTPSTDLAPAARYWLSRGVSGFYIQTPPDMISQDRQIITQSVRKITSSTVGARIVISDFSPDANAATAPQLQVDARWSQVDQPAASSLRPLLTQSLAAPNVLLAFHPSTPAAPDLANAIAAIQLAIHPAALMPTAATPQATDWIRQLAALHHDNAALRYGNTTFLDFDAQNTLVWISRPTSALIAPVVVACNLSSAPVKLSLTAAIKALGLHGWFLRTLLRTDQAMGAQNLDSVTVPPYGVYIGELHR